jgi:transcriptional regulator with XRE-family HTH domain
MSNLGDDYLLLGLGLRALRKRAGLTQVQAAEAVEVRPQSISQVERAERGMRWGTLLALLAAYDSDLHQLAAEIDRIEAA